MFDGEPQATVLDVKLSDGRVDALPKQAAVAACSDPPKTRCWTINGDFLTLKPTGVARYAREVVAALDDLMGNRAPLTQGLNLRIVAPSLGAEPMPLNHIAVELVPELRLRLPQVWVQLQLPRHVPGGLLSFCNLAPLQVRRQIVCMHDAQTYTMPQSYGPLFRFAHRVILPRLGRRVAKITTVSELSRQQLAAFGVAPLSRTVVTHNGADHASRWRPSREGREWPMRRPFVIGIGRGEAHKNMELIRRLGPALDAEGLDIALIGNIDRDVLARGGGLSPNLHLLGRVSDDEMALLFTRAVCFIFPSRTEGFGLPAVEAMTWGCPVVVSTAPALREVCGPAALYADPDDVEGWSQAVTVLASDQSERARLIDAGLKRAAGFSWTNIARTYLRLMAEVDGVVPSPRPREPLSAVIGTAG